VSQRILHFFIEHANKKDMIVDAFNKKGEFE